MFSNVRFSVMTRKRRNEGNESGGNFDEGQFAKKYGYVGGGGGGELEAVLAEDNGTGANEEKRVFPSELVLYLKNVIQMIEGGEEKSDILVSRCVDECSGEEERVLSFQESCRIIEKLFGDHSLSSTSFLRSLTRIKQKKLADILFSGCASRTIEILLYAMIPIEKNEQIEILTKLSDLMADHFIDASLDSHASFILRALITICCGLKRKEEDHSGWGHKKIEVAKPEKPSFANDEMEEELRRVRERLVRLCSDYSLLAHHIDSPTVSRVIQCAMDADCAVKGKAANAFVQGALDTIERDSSDSLIKSFEGRNSSRVWEKVVTVCDEDSRLRIWQLVVGGETAKCIAQSKSFFFLQTLLKSAKSLELATDMMDDLSPLLPTLLDTNKTTLVSAMVACAAKFPDLQPPLLKRLRRYFDASTASTRTRLLFNMLTWNVTSADERRVESSTVHGSVLIQSLLTLVHCKSLQECIIALPPSTIREMSVHRIASHVLQAFLQSNNVHNETKDYIIKAFENSWPNLIESPCGSFVFDSIWNCSHFDVSRKQILMKKLIGIHNTSKSWKCTMYKCETVLFKKNINEWLNKWKQNGQKGGKNEKNERRQEKIRKKKDKKDAKKALVDNTDN